MAYKQLKVKLRGELTPHIIMAPKEGAYEWKLSLPGDFLALTIIDSNNHHSSFRFAIADIAWYFIQDIEDPAEPAN